MQSINDDVLVQNPCMLNVLAGPTEYHLYNCTPPHQMKPPQDGVI